MNKKNFVFITLCLSGLISTTHAEVPSDKTIISWITNLQDPNANPQQAIQIHHTEKVK